MINMNRNKVICYPQPSARVSGAFLNLNRYTSAGISLEESLAILAGVKKDNHVVYAIVPEKEGCYAPLYVWCTDSLIRIGTEFIEGS